MTIGSTADSVYLENFFMMKLTKDKKKVHVTNNEVETELTASDLDLLIGRLIKLHDKMDGSGVKLSKDKNGKVVVKKDGKTIAMQG